MNDIQNSNNELRGADRRAVLKSIPATVLGGSLVAGTASAGQTETHNAIHDQTENENTIEIDAEHDEDTNERRFDLSTTETPSGWVTITFNNQTDNTHFVALYKLPQAAIDAAEQLDELAGTRPARDGRDRTGDVPGWRPRLYYAGAARKRGKRWRKR